MTGVQTCALPIWVATVVGSKCGGVSPASRDESPLRSEAATAVAASAAAWESFAPHAALEATWRLIGATNAYLEQHAPWKMEPGASVDAVMGDALEALRIITVLIVPAMPSTAQEIWRRLGLPGDVRDVGLTATSWGGFPVGATVTKGDPLFPRISANL